MSARNGRYVTCKECDTRFYVPNGREKEGRGKYCSRECMKIGFSKRVGVNNSNFKGPDHSFTSVINRRNGTLKTQFKKYVRVTRPDGKSKWSLEHVVIAEKALGRKLRKGECVHHIDMDALNNKPSNLLICSNAYHAWLHGQYAEKFAELRFRGN